MEISGVGEKFLKKYGHIFIEMVKSFKNQSSECIEYKDKTFQDIDDDIEIKKQKLRDDYKKRHQESLRNRKKEPRWLWTPYGGKRR